MHDNNIYPLVSIICLCYNHASWVEEALHSVKKQTYPNIELIIVDDNSTDDSKQVITKWIANDEATTFIANPGNLGNTKSFNNALKLAKGDFIIDFATDDVLMPNCVSLLIEKFKITSHSNVGIVYGNAERIDENGNAISPFFSVDSLGKTTPAIPTGNIYYNVVHSGSVVCAVAMLVKRKVYETIGAYDETLAYEDLDFWIRASRVYDFDYVDAIVCKKRLVNHSLGNQYSKKLNSRSIKINRSTFTVLKNTFENRNRSRAEDLALLTRVHYEITVNFKNGNWLLVAKYFWLKFRIHSKKY